MCVCSCVCVCVCVVYLWTHVWMCACGLECMSECKCVYLSREWNICAMMQSRQQNDTHMTTAKQRTGLSHDEQGFVWTPWDRRWWGAVSVAVRRRRRIVEGSSRCCSVKHIVHHQENGNGICIFAGGTITLTRNDCGIIHQKTQKFEKNKQHFS